MLLLRLLNAVKDFFAFPFALRINPTREVVKVLCFKVTGKVISFSVWLCYQLDIQFDSFASFFFSFTDCFLSFLKFNFTFNYVKS